MLFSLTALKFLLPFERIFSYRAENATGSGEVKHGRPVKERARERRCRSSLRGSAQKPRNRRRMQIQAVQRTADTGITGNAETPTSSSVANVSMCNDGFYFKANNSDSLALFLIPSPVHRNSTLGHVSHHIPNRGVTLKTRH